MRFLIMSVSAVLFGASALTFFYASSVQAEVYNLYPTTCLGGWEHPHLATGKPEAIIEGSAPVFTDENSAKLLGNTHAQIYCGGFLGDVLENTIPKKILVKFSWSVVYPEQKPAQSEEVVLDDDINTETQNQEDILEAENILAEEISERAAIGDAVEVDKIETPIVEEEQTIEINETPTEVGGTDVVEETATTEPVVEPAPSPIIEEPTSFIEWLIPVAHAQEIDVESSDVIPETEIATSTANVEDGSQGIVEVLYTLNGITWKSLGYVDKDAFSDISHEVPIEEVSDWEEISNLQIAVQSVPVLDAIAPVLYLDSVWIEVEYGFLEEKPEDEIEHSNTTSDIGTEPAGIVLGESVESNPDEGEEVTEELLFSEESTESLDSALIIEPVSLPRILKPRWYKKDIVLDKDASHACYIEPFTIDISGRNLLSTKIYFTRSIEKDYEVEIGGLPRGISVFFSNNESYIYALDSSETSLSLRIKNDEKSYEGNFTIPVLFTEKGDGGKKDSLTVCQMNIINIR